MGLGDNVKMWSGDFVAEELSISFHEDSSVEPIIPLESLVGLSLRDNPKRAHLLVSTVLGKHIPQHPLIIETVGKLLARQVWEQANGADSSVSDEALRLFGLALEGDNVALQHCLAALGNTFLTNVATIGYAETATSLGATVAEALNSYYVHSSRYPDFGAVSYGTFEESHSHATSHFLTPSDASFLNDESNDIVLVDDEISTGSTLMNTIAMLESLTHHDNYFLVSLVDLRTFEDRQRFDEFAEKLGINIYVASLYSGTVLVPANAKELAQPVIRSIKSEKPHIFVEAEQVADIVVLETHLPLSDLKNGQVSLAASLPLQAQSIASVARESIMGRTLVLGLEEKMYLPLLVAKFLSYGDNNDVLFSTTTRSPVISYDSEDYAIRTKIEYKVPFVEGDTQNRYAYNIDDFFDSVLIVVDSAEELKELENPDGLLGKLKHIVRKIVIVKNSSLPEPLSGPEFGSYAESDVRWLLKDLSNFNLEASLESREADIQKGKKHYAETLPEEYQPSVEYQDLFKVSLEDSKHEIAESIANVGEVIYQERNQDPVLVSLARAGTPVGILIKRYLEKTYGHEVPHYAVSIVRGKGIDYNALNYLAANYAPSRIMFVDGWTGKGAISKQLNASIEQYRQETGVAFSPDMAVLADPGNCVQIYGTRDDFLIPSACLNSTVSGLISRTVLNDELIGENDYHGAKFYSEFAENDYSNLFVDKISELFSPELSAAAQNFRDNFVREEPTWSGWATVERIDKEQGLNNINFVKPGVGETTRVLLRRVPWKIIIRPDKVDSLKHIKLLAENRGVPLEFDADLPYACIGLIKPSSDDDKGSQE
jgi:pyrimidine operon attenuation protein/uracil phosphoribosyltransferase